MGKAVETIAKEMEASRYHIRTPAFWDGLPGSYTQAFGMISGTTWGCIPNTLPSRTPIWGWALTKRAETRFGARLRGGFFE